MKLHHVGIAVATIEDGAKTFRHFHGLQIARESGPVHDPLQNADLHLFELTDGSRVELVAGKPVLSTLGKGLTLHHLCYEVTSVQNAINEWHRRGALIVSPAKPAVLFGGRLVAFVLTPLGLMEFLNDE